MGMKIRATKAVLKHLNVRKDGPDDEQILAVDAKLQTTVPAIELPPLVGDEGSLPRALWAEDGAPRFWSIREVRFDAEFPHHTLRLGELVFRDVTLKRFVVTPRDGHDADVTFQAQIHPTSNEVAILAEHVTETLTLRVEPEGELPLEGGGRPEPEPRESSQVLPFPGAEDTDPLYSDAYGVVVRSQKASTAALQRTLKIGYSRAARLMEQLEAHGVVSKPEANGVRRVLVHIDWQH